MSGQRQHTENSVYTDLGSTAQLNVQRTNHHIQRYSYTEIYNRMKRVQHSHAYGAPTHTHNIWVHNIHHVFVTGFHCFTSIATPAAMWRHWCLGLDCMVYRNSILGRRDHCYGNTYCWRFLNHISYRQKSGVGHVDLYDHVYSDHSQFTTRSIKNSGPFHIR